MSLENYPKNRPTPDNGIPGSFLKRHPNGEQPLVTGIPNRLDSPSAMRPSPHVKGSISRKGNSRAPIRRADAKRVARTVRQAVEGSGKTSFQPEDGWLALIRRLRRAYRCAISSNSTLVSAWSFSHIRQIVQDDQVETIELRERRRQLQTLTGGLELLHQLGRAPSPRPRPSRRGISPI